MLNELIVYYPIVPVRPRPIVRERFFLASRRQSWAGRRRFRFDVDTDLSGVSIRPTQRTQRRGRKQRNETTPLLDRPVTAASDDGVCRWHAAKLWQTHAIKYEIIEIKFNLHH